MSAERAMQTVQEAPVIAADATSIMQVISRAASDPNTDVEKLSRLMDLYERISARTAEQAFHEAMNAAQTELRVIGKDATSDKGKYASFVAIDKVARPIYSNHGFSLSFDTGDGAPADHIRLLCYVAHSAGHTRTYHVDMPADGKGAKGGDVMTKTHATGAALTYGQRYLLKLIFNIAVGEDKDGNAPDFPGDRITEAQMDDLVALMDEVGADRTKFLNYLRVESLAHLPKRRFAEAVSALEKKRRT